jgi:hypothetical protein
MSQRARVVYAKPASQIRGVKLAALKQQLQNEHARFRAENFLRLQG